MRLIVERGYAEKMYYTFICAISREMFLNAITFKTSQNLQNVNSWGYVIKNLFRNDVSFIPYQI